MVEQIDIDLQTALNLRRDDLPDIELQLLVDALLRYAACDFRYFNQSVLRRRIADGMRAARVETISAFQDRILHNEAALAAFAVSVSGGISPLFVDPAFFRAYAINVIPLLKTYSFLRIWIPSVGTGSDAYVLAALLDEAGLLDRTVIYMTLFNDVAASIARPAVFTHEGSQRVEAAARIAGLERPLAEHFNISGEHASPNDRLRQNVMIARHNPATDGSINEFHSIISRGVISLLNGAAQFRFYALLLESLTRLGFLGLGSNENVANTVHEGAFRRVVADHPIFRRMR